MSRTTTAALSASFVCWLATAASFSPVRAQDAFIENAHLLDPRSGSVERGSLLIEGGVIAGRPSAPPAGFSGAVVDAGGGWVVPGLRDLHVHSSITLAPRAMDMHGAPKAAERMLRTGVVGFLDLFSDEQLVLRLRDEQRQRGPVGRADFFAAGPCLTASGGHCTEYPTPTRVIDTPAQARQQIGELAQKRPDVIKLVYAHASPGATRPARPTLDRETFRAALMAAREHGIPSVVHIRSWRDVREALIDGASAVTHLPGHEAPPGIEELFLEHGTAVIPTLSVGDLILVTDKARLDDPLLRSVALPRVVEAYREYDTTAEGPRNMLRALEEAQGHRRRTIARLAGAGVPIIAGTDAGNWFTLHGYSLHRELELYVEAGLSPLQAIRSATVAAGDFLGQRWGLEAGDEGSVLILEASPLEDIRNSRRLRAVVHHGAPIPLEPAEREASETAKPPRSKTAAAR